MSADIVGDLRRVEAERDALRAQVERVRALADEWATKQRRNREWLLPGSVLLKTPAFLESFEPVSELRAALGDDA